ncbi:MAG: hypothetical protein COB74_01930 [Shewanella sp.]|nr:MAG: hypothetical protein COB74_01930 [Shewanella sp.]
MKENWQFWLTSAIAAFALYNSIKARSEAKKANHIATESHRKNELNQHYPPLSFKVCVENSRVKFVVHNESPSRETMIVKVKFRTEMRIGDMRRNKEYSIDINKKLLPESDKEVDCEEFNDYLSKLVPIIYAESNENANIFIMAWLESKPAIYESEIVRENLEATISHNGNELNIIRHTH